MVDEAENQPGINEYYDKEVTLDIDVAGAVAPKAAIVVYFAPHTERGWIDALSTAVHDSDNHPSILSISWGAAELQQSNTLIWTHSGMQAMHELLQDAARLGVTVLAASGDFGTWCKIDDLQAHVLFPAADPGIIACGGTEAPNISYFPANEETWVQSGGGVSEVWPPPAWQQRPQSPVDIPRSVNDGASRRSIPDVAGYAAPGCRFIYKYDTSEREDYLASGTSITTPLYAGLMARISAKLGGPLGHINADLYALAGKHVFKDIADDRWNAYAGAPGYVSGKGWDACTGLGVVDGTALLQALSPPSEKD